MANRAMKFGVAAVVSLCLVGTAALAQTGGGAASQMAPGMMSGPEGTGMHEISRLMHDMDAQMMGMSGQMGRGNMTPAQQKRMSERMRRMAGMMGTMSRMMGGGLTMDAGQQKQMNRMRDQMNEMMKSSPTHGGEK